jgi:6-phosphofructokinase
VVTDDAIAEAVCRILATAKTRRYVVTARAVMRVLGREMPHGALRAALNKYGFRYVRAGTADIAKYIVDVESARPICEKIMKRKKRALF